MREKREDVSSTRGKARHYISPKGHALQQCQPCLPNQSRPLSPPVSKLESVIPGLNASESVVLRPCLRIWRLAGVQGETCNRIVSSSVWRCFGVVQPPTPVQRLGPCIYSKAACFLRGIKVTLLKHFSYLCISCNCHRFATFNPCISYSGSKLVNKHRERRRNLDLRQSPKHT
jgi:hypothetical protein